MIEEIQSGIGGLTNESIQELISLIDLAVLQASQKPTLQAYKYVYDLLDRMYVKTHFLLDESEYNTIKECKNKFFDIYNNLMFRMAESDELEESSPTLRDLYKISSLANAYNAALMRGLQKKKYFYSTRGDATNNYVYYDPFMDEENESKKRT